MHTDQKATPNNVTLDRLTTLGLGGPAESLVEVFDASQTVAAVRSAAEASKPILVLAGGSNVVVSDAGFAGTVVLLRSTGVTKVPTSGDEVTVRVAAGHELDALVAECVAEGLSGIECLSGVPGSVGATPIQNVGAYGREISEVLQSVTVYDREQDRLLTLGPEQCGFSYRNSVFKHSERYVVLDVTLTLRRDATAAPLRYGELSRRLGADGERRVPLTEVREAVLELRRAKGMVIDAADPDSRSAGSFFTNPILTPQQWTALAGGQANEPPHWELPDGSVKVAAAWLIEHAGFGKGYRRGGAGISSKHTLALVNHGGTTAELLDLAREITEGVHRRYGVTLVPEPVLVGTDFAAGTEPIVTKSVQK